MATRLLLVRHARHAVADSVLAGRSPGVHLSAEGRAQAARLGRYLTHRDPTLLACSPQPRAVETAEGMALGLQPRITEALDEIDFGPWAGQAFAALNDDPAWRRWNAERATARPPGGEGMADVQARLLRWTASLPDEATILAVSHGDVIKAALFAHLGLSPDAHWRLDIAPASVSELELWPGGGRVLRVNDTTAAEDPA